MPGASQPVGSGRLGPVLPMAAAGAAFGFLVVILFWIKPMLLLLAAAGGGVLAFAVLSGLGKRLFILGIAFVLPMDLDVHFLAMNLRVSVTSLAVLLLWGIWLLERASDDPEPFDFFPAISVPALAFLVVTGISLALNGGGVQMARLFEPACHFLMYLYFANALRTETAVREVVIALLAGVLFQCGMALIELVGGMDLTLELGAPSSELWMEHVGGVAYRRISGLTEHANVLAVLLAAAVVFWIALGFAEKRRSLRLACWGSIAIACFVIVNTFSRSAWGVLALFAPAVFLLNLWKLGNLQKALLPIGLGIAILGAGALSNSLSNRVTDRLEVDISVMSRAYQVQIGANMLKDSPAFGVGPRNYQSHMFRYDDTDVSITSIFPGTLHNVYALIAAEQGLLGLLTFLWLNAAAFVRGLRFIPMPVSFLSAVGLSTWCWIFMFLIFGLANPFPRFSYFYMPLGLMVAVGALCERRDAKASAPTPDLGLAGPAPPTPQASH